MAKKEEEEESGEKVGTTYEIKDKKEERVRECFCFFSIFFSGTNCLLFFNLLFSQLSLRTLRSNSKKRFINKKIENHFRENLNLMKLKIVSFFFLH